MRTNKSTFTLAVILIAMTTTFTYAKKRIDGNPSNIANRKVLRMQKDIVLTDSQQIKIKSLTVEYIKQINDAQENQVTAISVKHRVDLDSVLTIEQREQIKTKRIERIKKTNK